MPEQTAETLPCTWGTKTLFPSCSAPVGQKPCRIQASQSARNALAARRTRENAHRYSVRIQSTKPGTVSLRSSSRPGPRAPSTDSERV
jgi:hypothetical protein